MAVIKMSSSSMSSDMDSDFDVGDVEEGATVGSIQVSMHDPQVFRSLMKSESDEIPSDVESESEQPLKDKEEIPEIQPETAKLNAEISRNNKPKVPQKASVNSQPRQKPKNIQKNIDFTQKMTRSLSHSSLDFENPQKSHRENIDIDERFYKYQEKVKEKVDKLAKDITQDQMKECTFQPAIKNDGQRRTVDEFVSEMQKYEKDKQNKLTAQREENLKTQNSVEQSYQPVICEKSLQILAKKGDPNTSVHEKLYKIDKSKPSKQVEKIKQEYSMIEKSSFKPLVNQKSHGLKRSDSIDKLLYDDALRRIHKEVEIPSLKKEKFISERSEQVLINKLTKEFAEIFDMLDIDNSGILNYINTLNLLQKLYMIKNDPENPKHEDEKALVLKM